MSNAQIDNVCMYVYCLLLRLEHLIFVFFLIKILDCIVFNSLQQVCVHTLKSTSCGSTFPNVSP